MLLCQMSDLLRFWWHIHWHISVWWICKMLVHPPMLVWQSFIVLVSFHPPMDVNSINHYIATFALKIKTCCSSRFLENLDSGLEPFEFFKRKCQTATSKGGPVTQRHNKVLFGVTCKKSRWLQKLPEAVMHRKLSSWSEVFVTSRKRVEIPVSNTDANSYSTKTFIQVLRICEAEKNYHPVSFPQPVSFNPFAVSVNGVLWKEI